MSNSCNHKTMNSETGSAPRGSALLVYKSKPKVKIRKEPLTADSRWSPAVQKINNLSYKLRMRPATVGVVVVLVCLLLDNRQVVVCRSYSDTEGHQHHQKAAASPTTEDHSPREQNQGLVTVMASSGVTSTPSEISLEYLDLRLVPSAQLCELKEPSQVNSVSFANNQIKSIDSSAFICISLRLKILDLRNNKIESISEDAFKGLGQLQVLVLNGNQLKKLPWKQLTASYLPLLRHLSIAYNRIRSIDASEPLVVSNLISLDLRGNPLERIHWKSLNGLAKLQTLTLSQLNLRTHHLVRFDGLPELRFAHLEQLGRNLGSLDGQFCETSRKLATLSLKANQLEQVPQFTSCHGLLSLDLSYNRIHGTLAGNFSRLNNLIDLYLGHNQLEFLDESAFVGLGKLQVLELNSNKITTIHSNAFIPIRATLRELNIANNIQLSQLTSNGLERLVSLKSYGNIQLRKLPAGFPSARELVLTFAYHCCDYYHCNQHHYQAKNTNWTTPQAVNLKFATNELESTRGGKISPTDTRLVGGNDDAKEADARFAIHQGARRLGAAGEDGKPEDSLVSRWSKLIWSKIVHFFPQSFLSERDEGEPRLDKITERDYGAHSDETASSQNFSELVLWQPKGAMATATATATEANERAAPAASAKTYRAADNDDDEYFRASNLQQHNSQATPDESLARPETLGARHRQSRMSRPSERVELVTSRKNVAVIDELIWYASRIRSAHLQAAERPIIRIDQDDEDDDGRRWLARLDDEFADEQVANDESLDLRAELVARALANQLEVRHSIHEGRRGGRQKRGPTRRATSGSSESLEELQPDEGSHQRTVKCLPRPDAFQPCHDLFDSIWLRAGIWMVFLFAFAGNILVIVVLSSVKPSSSTSALTSIMWFNAAQSKRHIDVPRFLVINLAFADLMMAIYLGLLALIDLSTLGEFRFHAIKWQYSTGCKLAGFLAVLSSELSVFILAIITLERNYAITNAVHLNRRLSLQKAMVIMFFGYLYALTMAIMPLNGINDYRKFSICLPLDFNPNNMLAAPSLYLILLISINSLSFVLLLSCYLRMYCAIRGSQAWSTNDMKIAKRMSILVVTDFLCWSPIIFVAILALFGYYLVGTEGLKVLIIFVLPLNSVANPFLYAITTKKFKRDLTTLKKRLRVDQALEGLSRVFAYLTPIYGSWRGGTDNDKHQSASWTLRGDTGGGGGGNNATSMDPIYCRAVARRSKKLKKNPVNCLQAMNENRANGSKQRAKSKTATATAAAKQEILLVTQNGQSVLADGQQTGHRQPKLIQFRSTAVDRPEQANSATNSVDVRPDCHLAGSRRLITHCANCHSRLVVRPQAAVPIELSSSDLSRLGHTDRQAESSCGAELHQGAYLAHERGVTTGPRIVLGSIDPEVDVSTSPVRPAIQPHCTKHLANKDSSGRCQLPEQTDDSCISGARDNSALVHQVSLRQFSVSDTIEQLQRQTHNTHDQQVRASSADKPNGAQLLSLIVSHADGQPSPQLSITNRQLTVSGSCGTTRIVAVPACCKNSLDVNLPDCGIVDAEVQNNRSVSACAFNWPVVPDGTQVVGRKGHYLTATTPRACYSCSCDTIQVGPGRDGSTTTRRDRAVSRGAVSAKSVSTNRHDSRMPGVRTRSISRFVIGPLVKAWSSLQLSLQFGPTRSTTVVTRTTTVPPASQLQKGSTATELASQRHMMVESQKCQLGDVENHHSDGDDESESESTEKDGLLADFHESSIIDDVLQMSSPKRRQLLMGRRMSRSCDIIVETSTTTTAEPTSSFYDPNDDQRILLATINQLNSRARKKRKQTSSGRQVDDSQRVREQTIGGRRLNCTRCRSWSPALLDKLEDCMHQIKTRIPKFTNKNNLNHSGDRKKQVQQSSVEGSMPRMVILNETQPSVDGSSTSPSHSSLNLSEPIDDEEDEFNEIGLDDWTRNMQKKAPPNCYSKSVSRRHKLRQQLSGNSDTLSARTVGTTLTNVSFDSSSNIPNVLGSNENAVHPSVSSSLASSVSNIGARTADNEP